MVIVCGSANSWMMNSLINNHGGLYNRVTYEIKLAPFTLRECEAFFQENNISLSKYDIAQSYMIFGGIPYYLGYFDGEYSLAQNVDKIVFSRNAKLKNEYDRLYQSVFVNPNIEKAIVAFLATRNAGFTRKEVSEKLGISDGGRLSRYLNALISSDFVVKYVPFGMGKREEHYKVVDPFCLFCLHFNREINSGSESFWQENVTAQPVVTWRGLAFEHVCFNHISQNEYSGVFTNVITLDDLFAE